MTIIFLTISFAENWKCEFDEFKCPSGRCIPVVWQCDGKPDCDNHTDEYNCQRMYLKILFSFLSFNN